MSDVVPPVGSERTLAQLPELLAGSAPNFGARLNRRWLASADGRAALRELAAVATAMRGSAGPRRLVVDPRVARVVGRIERLAQRRSIAAMRDLLANDVIELLRRASRVCVRTRYDAAAHSSRGELAARLRRVAHSPSAAAGPAIMPSRFAFGPSRRVVFAMLDWLDRAAPSAENTLARLVLARNLDGKPIGGVALRIARDCEDLGTVERAVLLHGLGCADRGEYRAALDCASEASKLSSRPAAAAFNGFVAAVACDDAVAMREFTERFEMAIDRDRTAVADYRTAFEAATETRRRTARRDSGLSRVWTRLLRVESTSVRERDPSGRFIARDPARDGEGVWPAPGAGAGCDRSEMLADVTPGSAR